MMATIAAKWPCGPPFRFAGDMALWKATGGMILVPLVLGESPQLMTAVRLARDEPFGESEARLVCGYAGILANLMERNLTAIIIG